MLTYDCEILFSEVFYTMVLGRLQNLLALIDSFDGPIHMFCLYQNQLLDPIVASVLKNERKRGLLRIIDNTIK